MFSIDKVNEVYKRIADDYYENKMDFPGGSSVNPDVRIRREAYHTETARMNQMFAADALEACGLTGHPKAEKVYNMAWQEGHSSGYNDVLNYLVDLADLLL